MNTIISQALATGLPVITTRHSGLPDQVKDGKNGFLVNEGDYQTLAEKILYIMEHPELLAPFGQFGREHVLEHYNAQPLVEKQIQFYRDIINQET